MTLKVNRQRLYVNSGIFFRKNCVTKYRFFMKFKMPRTSTLSLIGIDFNMQKMLFSGIYIEVQTKGHKSQIHFCSKWIITSLFKLNNALVKMVGLLKYLNLTTLTLLGRCNWFELELSILVEMLSFFCCSSCFLMRAFMFRYKQASYSPKVVVENGLLVSPAK